MGIEHVALDPAFETCLKRNATERRLALVAGSAQGMKELLFIISCFNCKNCL